ncbi:MAG: hypothetical protein ABSG43_07155 [Solirubrobacteraceae bacterium]|jgi:hypothetical protein
MTHRVIKSIDEQLLDWVAEPTDHVDVSAWPHRSRLVVRRERPRPGAQFRIFDEHGDRHACFSHQPGRRGPRRSGVASPRPRARLDDSNRAGKDNGVRNLPHHAFERNQSWLELSLIAQDLLC